MVEKQRTLKLTKPRQSVKHENGYIIILMACYALGGSKNSVHSEDIMNKALTIQANAVKKYGGMVDKFIGDAMMAIFNAPIDLDMHEDRAILTAIEIKKQMEKANLGIQIGMGINSGVVMLANCGSKDRFDYTAIGSNVNLAARCESSCKTVGEDIVIAKNTAQQTDIALRKLKPVEMKGIEEPVEIYTVDLTNFT